MQTALGDLHCSEHCYKTTYCTHFNLPSVCHRMQLHSTCAMYVWLNSFKHFVQPKVNLFCSDDYKVFVVRRINTLIFYVSKPTAWTFSFAMMALCGLDLP